MGRMIIFASLVICVFINHAEGQGPPRFIKQPPNGEIIMIAKNNEDYLPFTIECEVQGQLTHTYLWMRNGKKFHWQTYGSRITQNTDTGTLVFHSPVNEDIGQYQCFAENILGIATSNSVFVKKAVLKPFVERSLNEVMAMEGFSFMMTCYIPDGWPEPQVTWILQSADGKIKGINSSRMTVDPEGNLQFSNVEPEDASDEFLYTCVSQSLVLNRIEIGNKFMLKVFKTGIQNRIHSPQIQYVSKKNEIGYRGKTVEIFCLFSGSPTPLVVWTKDDVKLEWSNRIIEGDYGRSLIIKKADYDDSGIYTCEVDNDIGPEISHSTNLKIMGAPYFTTQPESFDKANANGRSVELDCRAMGIPTPDIKWTYNGKPIEEAPPNSHRIFYGANSIVINTPTYRDIGNYGCNASNYLGYVYKDVTINA